MSCESGLRRRESGLGLNRFVSSSSWRAVSCLSNVRLILRHVVPPQGCFDCIGHLLKQVFRQEIERPGVEHTPSDVHVRGGGNHDHGELFSDGLRGGKQRLLIQLRHLQVDDKRLVALVSEQAKRLEGRWLRVDVQ